MIKSIITTSHHQPNMVRPLRYISSFVISRLDRCNSLLARPPLSTIRSLQLIQNGVSQLVFNLPMFSNTTPPLHFLLWLSVAARIRFKTLVLASHCTAHPPILQLCSTSPIISQGIRKACFRTFLCFEP